MHETPSLDAEWDRVMAACAPLLPLWASVDLTLSARRAAHALGFRNSDKLRDWLHERGLPPYLVLRNWYYLVRLLELAERGSLSRWALEGARDPATYYRFAKRATGNSWAAICDHGVRSMRASALDRWRPWRGT